MKAGESLSGSGAAPTTSDTAWMRKCIALARHAAALNEVPVGALVVKDGQVIAQAHNERESRQSPTAHAELLAIEQAARATGSWRLTDCTLYVTLEPCPMCAGAIINARVPRVVFGAYDPKAGAMGSLYNIHEGRLNHTPLVTGGVLADTCGNILREYFGRKRRQQKEKKKLGSQTTELPVHLRVQQVRPL